LAKSFDVMQLLGMSTAQSISMNGIDFHP